MKVKDILGTAFECLLLFVGTMLLLGLIYIGNQDKPESPKSQFAKYCDGVSAYDMEACTESYIQQHDTRAGR
jgi:hypothetical protein